MIYESFYLNAMNRFFLFALNVFGFFLIEEITVEAAFLDFYLYVLQEYFSNCDGTVAMQNALRTTR